jgi:hypothetical protein
VKGGGSGLAFSGKAGRFGLCAGPAGLAGGGPNDLCGLCAGPGGPAGGGPNDLDLVGLAKIQGNCCGLAGGGSNGGV